MASVHHKSHEKGGSDLKVAFTALVGGLLWIVAVGAVSHFLALGASESAESGQEAAH